MKVEELIQRILSLYSKGVQSDDARLTPRHVYNKLSTVRSFLLKQKIEKDKTLSEHNYQTIACVELIKTHPGECPCLPPVGCLILRSKNKIPKLMNNNGKHSIKSVSSIDGTVRYSETSWENKKYNSYSKYTGKNPDYFIHNDYLYVTYSKGPKVVSITALWEDPVEVNNFEDYCYNKDCEDCSDCKDHMGIEFPLDSDLLDILIARSVEELIGIFSKNRDDVTNNTRDNNIQETK